MQTSKRAPAWAAPLVLGLWAAVFSPAAPAMGQSQPVTEASPETDPLAQLGRLPETSEDVDARRELARARLAKLQPTTQPASAPADDAAAEAFAVRAGLYGDWEVYLARLERVRALRARIAELSSEEYIASIASELEAIKRETRELGGPEPLTATEEQVAAVRNTSTTLDARVESLAQTQARRNAQLSGGFQQQRVALEERLKQLRQEREQLQTQIDTAAPTTSAPSAAESLDVQRRRLAVQAATAELSLKVLELERHVTELEVAQDERLLAALREQRAAASRRLAQLTAARSRDALEVLRLERARTSDPVELALIDMREFKERVLLKYFQREYLLTQPRAVGAPRASLEETSKRIASSRGYWEHTYESLEHRTGDEALKLQPQVRDEQRELAERLERFQTRRSDALERLQTLRAVRERATQRLNRMTDDAVAQLPAAASAARTRLETQAANVRADLDKLMRTRIDELQEYLGRLNDIVTQITGQLDFLDDVERRIRWTRIASRDSGMLGADWKGAWSELRTLAGAAPKLPPTTEREDEAALDLQLFGTRSDARETAVYLWTTVREELAAAGRVDWLWSGGVLLVAAVLGYVLRRGARRRGVALAKHIESEYRLAAQGEQKLTTGLSGRLDLMWWNLLGDLAIPLLVAGALWLGAARLLEDPTLRTLVARILIILTAALVILRLVHHVFEADSPPHRPIPCSDGVARHYRRWLDAMTLWSLFVLPIPILLSAAQIGPALQGVTIEIYKMGLLTLLLLFLLKRDRVFGAAEWQGRHWAIVLARIAFPVFVVAVAGLMILQIIGYGVLVTFVGTGLLLTVAIVLALSTVTEYLADMLDRYAHPRDARRHGQRPLVTPGGDGEHADADEAAERSRKQYAVVLFKWVIRAAGLIGGAVLILQVWNLRIRTEWLNWNIVGLSALVVLIALLADRVLYTTSVTLHRSGRLPENTANMIRRWARSVLTLLTILALAAVAGFKIDSIWTLLTTLLAMVAIGFVAVWSMLSNIMATIVILIWRPFNVGEQIEILPEALGGQVVDINFMFTVLKSDNNTRISVPNNTFAQKFIRRQMVRGMPRRTLAEQLEAEKPLV